MSKSEKMSKRIIMAVFGTVICGIAVGLLRNSKFGVDPFQCFCGGIGNVIPIDFGTLYAIISFVLLLFMFFLYRKSVGIYTFVNMFFLGYLIDFSDKIIMNCVPDAALLVRIVFLVGGLLLVSLGAAFIFSADLGVSTYDWVAFKMSDKIKKLPFKYARIITDLVCCTVGFLLGLIPGIATILTALCMGPFIAFFRRTMTDPLVAK